MGALCSRYCCTPKLKRCCYKEPLLRREKLEPKEIVLILDQAGSIEEKCGQCLKHLEAHGDDVQMVGRCCEALAALAGIRANRGRMAKLGAIKATTKAMLQHPLDKEVQRWGCALLCLSAKGIDANGFERKQQAADEGAIEALITAMRTHPQFEPVVELGCAGLANVVMGDDALSLDRGEQAEAGIELVVAALRHFAKHERIQFYGRSLLNRLCRVKSGFAPEEKTARARDSGALDEWLMEPPHGDARGSYMDQWHCSVRESL